MFCPICKAEYRFGFTRCSDCDVDLVETLPEEPGPAILEDDPEEMIVLWAGIRDLTRQSIERALQEVNIKFETDTVDSQLMPAFRGEINRIKVRRIDYQAAAGAVQHRLGAAEPIG